MPESSPQLLLELLAAPRLLRGGVVVHVGSRKALAILALVALDRGGARPRLTTLLWPEVDAAAGRRNLRRELFRLRELGVPLEEAADGGLVLDPQRIEVDALRLVDDERLPETGGLALDGLDGVGSDELDSWLQHWRHQLAARHGQALDRQAEVHEDRGEVAEALALRLRGWALEPLHEPSAVHVMRLRLALGDRAGALQAYQRLADALRDELDIEPSTAAQSLAQSLREDAGGAVAAPLPPAVASPAAEPGSPVAAVASGGPGLPSVVPFVVRGAAQAQIEAAWSRRQRVYLHGPAGTGKTRLASELAAARGPWLRVACEPQDAELPYSSVVRLLRALRESAPDVELPDWVRRELAQLMPELGEPPRALATDEARQRLLAAAAEAWRLLMHDNFSAFVLDDWQWGDSASVELWSRLDDTAIAGDASVAWIISYRSAQLLPSALERQRADIDNRRAVAVALEGMDESEVLALTQALSGSADGHLFSQRLRDATDGNPFFLLETLRHLFEQRLLIADASGWSTPFDAFTESYAELPVPASVRATVLARARALGAAAQRLLEVASLCTGDIDASLLAAASGIDEERVVASLEHAQAAQLVGEDQGHWRFAHDLVRQSLAQGLSAARRRLLHDRLASRLERTRAAPSIIAAHWEAAERRHEALPWRVAAAESAVRLHALGDALSHYAQALADGAAGAAASRIHRAMAHIHARRADRAAAEAAFEAAIEAASGDALDGGGEALQGLLDRADHFRRTDRVDEAVALLDSLQPDLAEATPAQRAQALAARGSAMLSQGRHNEGLRLFLQAVDLLEHQPESRGQFGALLLEMARSALRSGDIEGARPIVQRSVAVHESIDAPSGLSSALTLLGYVHISAGEHAQAIAVIERARRIAHRCGDVPAQRGAILNLVKLFADAGDTSAAIALLDEGEALVPSFEHRRAELAFREARYCLHLLRGEVPEARAAAERLLNVGIGSVGPTARIGLLAQVVEIFILDGDLARARLLVDEAQGLCDAMEAMGDGNVYAAFHALKRSWLALAEGDPARALAGLPDPAGMQRVEDRVTCAWVGAAAERRLGDVAAARRRLDAVEMAADIPVDLLALWLIERLQLPSQEAAWYAAAEAHARELLAAARVPPLYVDRLERALEAQTPPG